MRCIDINVRKCAFVELLLKPLGDGFFALVKMMIASMKPARPLGLATSVPSEHVTQTDHSHGHGPDLQNL